MGNNVSFPGLGFELNVPREALHIGNLSIAWYGIIISAAIAIAIMYAFNHSDRFNLDNDKMLDAVIGGIIGAVIGARLYYVAMKHEDYKTFKDVINIREGGLAVYGGIIGALLVAYVICRIRKMRVLPLFDLAGICLCLGQAIGRWGNFFNQEAFGTNTKLPWGMTSDAVKSYILAIAPDGKMSNGKELLSDIPVHPCFLYESIWCLIGFILLAWFSKRRKFNGQIFLMYIGWYGLGRFFIEGLRTDSLYIGSIRVSQLVAALCVIAAVILLYMLNKRAVETGTILDLSALPPTSYAESSDDVKEKANDKKTVSVSDKKNIPSSDEENVETNDSVNIEINDNEIVPEDEKIVNKNSNQKKKSPENNTAKSNGSSKIELNELLAKIESLDIKTDNDK